MAGHFRLNYLPFGKAEDEAGVLAFQNSSLVLTWKAQIDWYRVQFWQESETAIRLGIKSCLGPAGITSFGVGCSFSWAERYNSTLLTHLAIGADKCLGCYFFSTC